MKDSIITVSITTLRIMTFSIKINKIQKGLMTEPYFSECRIADVTYAKYHISVLHEKCRYVEYCGTHCSLNLIVQIVNVFNHSVNSFEFGIS
jgi:hypothetical protein